MEGLLLLTLMVVGVIVLAMAVLSLRQRPNLATLVLSVIALGAVLAAGMTSMVINYAGDAPRTTDQAVNYDGTPLQ
jgi:energy-converting hydrogenase Eha subunit A